MTEPSEWMTIPDVADAFGVHRSTVWRWVMRGTLAAERRADGHPPGSFRVRRSDVHALAERNYTGDDRSAVRSERFDEG